MLSRREVALRLDIPLEMAHRHHLPSRMTEAQCAAIEQDPPAWLVQSRANRTGKKPVWVELTCYLCGFTESARPKKWWPTFTYLSCDHHRPDDLPAPEIGHHREEYLGVGSRFVGLVDVER